MAGLPGTAGSTIFGLVASRTGDGYRDFPGNGYFLGSKDIRQKAGRETVLAAPGSKYQGKQ